jgi:hypothetical protein
VTDNSQSDPSSGPPRGIASGVRRLERAQARSSKPRLTPHPSSLAEWDPDFLSRSPMFEPLLVHAPARGAGWPRLADLQLEFDARRPPVCNAGGMPLRLVPPGRKPASLEEKYEARIHLKGELQVREDDWHDYFNLLVWLALPATKAALNARHYAALREQGAAGAPNRGPVQDALTLFDEGGVIVASDDDELLACLREWRWKDLFWGHRARARARMRFFIFGHALYEKALRPFIGITGRGILLKTGPGLAAAPLREQLDVIDAGVAAYLSDPASLSATRELAVVPVLGVPGWCPDNEKEAFYDDQDYFRPGRSREKRESYPSRGY